MRTVRYFKPMNVNLDILLATADRLQRRMWNIARHHDITTVQYTSYCISFIALFSCTFVAWSLIKYQYQYDVLLYVASLFSWSHGHPRIRITHACRCDPYYMDTDWLITAVTHGYVAPDYVAYTACWLIFHLSTRKWKCRDSISSIVSCSVSG